MVKDTTSRITTTPKALYQYISDSLQGVIDLKEKQSIILLLLQRYFEINVTKLVVNTAFLFSRQSIVFLNQAIERLNKQEPIQYILEEAHFLGSTFRVNKNVLIPRFETEEMVQNIINRYSNQPSPRNILDIGTGSGCIAISLKKAFPDAQVTALDISFSALKVAQENAKKLEVSINFQQKNIFNEDFLNQYWELIVSNPPYVRNNEKKHMQEKVLNYEPHLALFVKDDAPLIFYEKLAYIGRNMLHDEGIICVEINEIFSKEVEQLFLDNDFCNIIVNSDLQKKKRWIIAKRKKRAFD